MTRWANENAYDDIILPLAQSYNLDPALVKAVIAEESKFNPTAYHWDGPDPILNVSRGLMQIEGVNDVALAQASNDVQDGPDAPNFLDGRSGGLYDPYLNVPIGVRMLAANLARTGGVLDAAIAAYNAGWSKVRPNDAPRKPDGTFVNQQYVNNILNDYYPYFQGQAGAAPTEGETGSSSTVILGAVVIGVFALALLLGRR